MNKTNNHERLLLLLERLERGGLRNFPMRDYELTIAQIALLANVARNPGAHIQELAESMDLTAPTVSVAVRKLEESGWLRREEDAEDKRASCIFLTEKAVEVIQKMMKKRQQKVAEVLNALTSAEQDQLINLLQKAIMHMEDEAHG
ncbi:MAG: MarR family transcriptional regulator [Chloroflexi bacterium]|nr:MarR family transcriptional regulator [Chloroflexota bacterium]